MHNQLPSKDAPLVNKSQGDSHRGGESSFWEEASARLRTVFPFRIVIQNTDALPRQGYKAEHISFNIVCLSSRSKVTLCSPEEVLGG